MNKKGNAMDRELPDVRANQSTPGFCLNDQDGDRLAITLSDEDKLLLGADADYLVFTREKAEQLCEALRRLLAGEPVKP